ncbi:hypothetical protein V6N13_018340 [Hibiscus sabdariffa]
MHDLAGYSSIGEDLVLNRVRDITREQALPLSRGASCSVYRTASSFQLPTIKACQEPERAQNFCIEDSSCSTPCKSHS